MEEVCISSLCVFLSLLCVMFFFNSAGVFLGQALVLFIIICSTTFMVYVLLFRDTSMTPKRLGRT